MVLMVEIKEEEEEEDIFVKIMKKGDFTMFNVHTFFYDFCTNTSSYTNISWFFWKVVTFLMNIFIVKPTTVVLMQHSVSGSFATKMTIISNK